MRKLVLTVGMAALSLGVASAQGKKAKGSETDKTTITSTPPDKKDAPTNSASTTLKADDMAFDNLTHDFGTVAEGPDATCVFTFKNTGKEPIVIQKAAPSCGCTVPSFSSEPVPPGGTGTINVAYHTKGKPNPFTKTINVTSNAGSKMLTIKGNVEKAPTGSVPENNSMLKTN
jgi:Protein of unknown function (DUF1573)